MKRMFILFVALVGSAFKNNAQTTIPFYGFELSNYEVGDTLEYSKLSIANGSNTWCKDTFVLAFIDKQYIGSDTVFYVAKKVLKGSCTDFMSFYDSYQVDDTTTWLISNDTIILNDNNLLHQTLSLYNASDTNASGDHSYDTLNGLKHLAANIYNTFFSNHYDALENLGITSYSMSGEDISFTSYSYHLLYANLQHYGLYGEYEPIIFTEVKSISQNDLVEVNYHELNKTLRITSGNSKIILKLYDVLGRNVLTVSVNENAIYLGNLPNGIYFYQVVGNQTASGKIFIR